MRCRSALLCLFLVVLSSCQIETRVALPSEEVLRRAVAFSYSLSSVSYALQLTTETRDDNPHVRFRGVMSGMTNGGGQQFYGHADVNVEVQYDNEHPSITTTDFEVIASTDTDTFFRVNTLHTELGNLPLPVEELSPYLEQWWLLPHDDEASTHVVSLTPSAPLLHMQAQVIQLSEDYGISRLGRRPVYHYGITVDEDALRDYITSAAYEEDPTVTIVADMLDDVVQRLHPVGEIFIDADTFAILRLNWKIQEVDLFGIPMAVQLRLDMDNHNDAKRIAFPTDALPFPRDDVESLIVSFTGTRDQISEHFDLEEGILR